jgi:HK97 family phage portal protein
MSDQQHDRGLPTVDGGTDPRERPANDNIPSDHVHTDPGPPPTDYTPVGVGPNSSEGFGNSHVMYPEGNVPVQPWSGWPVGWDTPRWNTDPTGWFAAMSDVAFSAIDLNTGILAAMPPYLRRDDEGEPPRPSWLINPEPSVYTSWDEFFRQMAWSFYAVGEVFIVATSMYADTTGRRPQRFMVVHPAYVQVDNTGGRCAYSIAGVPIPADEVCHVRYAWAPTSCHGVGPLEVAGLRLLAAEAITRYAAELAHNGGMPPAVLTSPRRTSREQMRQMQVDWINARRSALGAPAVLSDGVRLEQSPQPKDVALAELQRYSESRIANLLGVPPALLGLPTGGDSLTYSTTVQLFDFHWRAHLRPKAQLMTSALSNWLLPRGTWLELDREDYTRPGWLELTQGYGTLVGAGVLSPQDVRTRERWPGQAPGQPEADPEHVSTAQGTETFGADDDTEGDEP